MGFSLYHATRSVRATVTTPDGKRVVVENMDGNQGFYMAFEITRTMDDAPGDAVWTARNLPPDILGQLQASQVSKPDDLDALLVGKGLQSAVVAQDGSDASKAGFLILEVEAGYDGNVSRLCKAIGARIGSAPDADDVTDVTTVRASENLDGALLGLPVSAFTAGASLFSLLDYLRRIAGLGPGNLTPATLAALIGDSTLSSPYVVSGGQALAHLRQVLQYQKLRWFIDDRELWICARDEVPPPVAAPPPPWVMDGPPTIPPPILTRPQRDDAGFVTVTTFLCPEVRPGRLMRLTEDGLGLAQQGLSPSVAQARRANVPPGLYRVEEVTHRGDTADGEFSTTSRLRPVTAPGL